LLLALVAAVFLRFRHAGDWPPGFYRDEAYNALDALNVLAGQHALFFTANNGREPIYIYLVALSVALLGRTVLAERLPAGIVGVLATLPTFFLGRAWFGPLTGLLAAFLWATTFWPVHLGRVGLRAGLLAPALALALWAGTRAYRNGRAVSWFSAGLLYGLTFYTYLSARLTPLVLVLLAAYLLLTGRGRRLWSEGRVLWFAAGTALVVLPLAIVALNDPSILFGRAGQVSIFSPAVNGGDFWGTLARHTAEALGMTIWRGDTILRHNALLNYDAVLAADGPAGRPVFDIFMAGPFLAGLGWCLWNWRRAPAAALLLWQAVMLLPTILAEDTPHFLRAAGVLPGVVFFPAIGLALLWNWARLPLVFRRVTVVALLGATLWLTADDYATYAREPDVGHLFESAATQLAADLNDEAPGVSVALDRRFWDGWPSVRFLAGERPPALFEEGATPAVALPAAVYAWPFAPLDAVRAAAATAGQVTVAEGPLARGDLEPEAVPLYVRFGYEVEAAAGSRADNFGGVLMLRDAAVSTLSPTRIEVDLTWALPPGVSAAEALPTAFVHVAAGDGLIGQHDAPPGLGYWPATDWRPGLSVRERRIIDLARPYDPAAHTISAGLYWPESGERLPRLDAGYNAVDDKAVIQP
jgi:4-amino-4-deoxy-L-arabinose transferase-like glycosyltransferase